MVYAFLDLLRRVLSGILEVIVFFVEVLNMLFFARKVKLSELGMYL